MLAFCFFCFVNFYSVVYSCIWLRTASYTLLCTLNLLSLKHSCPSPWLFHQWHWVLGEQAILCNEVPHSKLADCFYHCLTCCFMPCIFCKPEVRFKSGKIFWAKTLYLIGDDVAFTLHPVRRQWSNLTVSDASLGHWVKVAS